MSDASVRDLERRVLSGDASALPLLRVAWWRLGEPTNEGPWQFGPFDNCACWDCTTGRLCARCRSTGRVAEDCPDCHGQGFLPWRGARA